MYIHVHTVYLLKLLHYIPRGILSALVDLEQDFQEGGHVGLMYQHIEEYIDAPG
jgi:hypothetical protein